MAGDGAPLTDERILLGVRADHLLIIERDAPSAAQPHELTAESRRLDIRWNEMSGTGTGWREGTTHGLISFTRPKGIDLPSATLSMIHAHESVRSS
jgi:hypothetical protein